MHSCVIPHLKCATIAESSLSAKPAPLLSADNSLTFRTSGLNFEPYFSRNTPLLKFWPINFFIDSFETRFSSSCKGSERKDNNDNNLGWYKPLKTMQNKGCARYMGRKVECFHIVNQRSILHVQHYVNKREQVKKNINALETTCI